MRQDNINYKQNKFYTKNKCKIIPSIKCDKKNDCYGSKNICSLLENEYCFCKDRFICNKKVYKIRKDDFCAGTYIIKKPGYYILCDDVEFNPNADFSEDGVFDENCRYPLSTNCEIIVEASVDSPSTTVPQTCAYDKNFDEDISRLACILKDNEPSTCNDKNKKKWYDDCICEPKSPKKGKPNNWKPILNKYDSEYNPDYDKLEYRQGFFAAIVVTCDHVIIDLNEKTISQHKAHALQQRYFSLIELNADHVFIVNGNLGLSSQHAIHGNCNKNILVKDITIKKFEQSGITLNGCCTVALKNVNIKNARSDVPVLTTYGHSRSMLQFLEKMIKRLNILVKLSAMLQKNDVTEIPIYDDEFNSSGCITYDDNNKILSCYVPIFDAIFETLSEMQTVCDCLVNVSTKIDIPLCETHLKNLEIIKEYLIYMSGYAKALGYFIDVLKNDSVYNEHDFSQLCTLSLCLNKIAQENLKLINKIFIEDDIISAKCDLVAIYENIKVYFQIMFEILENNTLNDTIQTILIDKQYDVDLARSILVYGNLKCMLNHAYNNIMDGKSYEIHPILLNIDGVPDKNMCGICIQPKGHENLDFSVDISDGVINNVCIKNVHVDNLCANVIEVVGLKKEENNNNDIYQTGPSNEVFDILNKYTMGTYNQYIADQLLDLSYCCDLFGDESIIDFLKIVDVTNDDDLLNDDDVTCDICTLDITNILKNNLESIYLETIPKPDGYPDEYSINYITQVQNNPLAVAQLHIAKIKFIEKIENPEEHGKIYISDDVISWAYNNSFSKFDLENTKLIFNGDANGSINKGVIGFKFDSVCNLLLRCCSVNRCKNIGKLGSELGGKYKIGHPKQTQIGYQGTTVRGISLTTSKNIIMIDTMTKDIWSYNGRSYGVHLHNNNKDVCVDGLTIDCIQAGQKYCINKSVSATELNDLNNLYNIYVIPPCTLLDYIFLDNGNNKNEECAIERGNLNDGITEDDGKLVDVTLLSCKDCCPEDAQVCWLGTGPCQERLHELDTFQTTFNLAPECLPILYVCEQNLFNDVQESSNTIKHQYTGTATLTIDPYTKKLTLGHPNQCLKRSHADGETDPSAFLQEPITDKISTKGPLTELKDINNQIIYSDIVNTFDNNFTSNTSVYEFMFENNISGDTFELKKKIPENDKSIFDVDHIILTDIQLAGFLNGNYKLTVTEHRLTIDEENNNLIISQENDVGISRNEVGQSTIIMGEDIDKINCEINNPGKIHFTKYTTDLPNHIPTANGFCVENNTTCIDTKCIDVGTLCSVCTPIEIKLPKITYSTTK